MAGTITRTCVALLLLNIQLSKTSRVQQAVTETKACSDGLLVHLVNSIVKYETKVLEHQLENKLERQEEKHEDLKKVVSQLVAKYADRIKDVEQKHAEDIKVLKVSMSDNPSERKVEKHENAIQELQSNQKLINKKLSKMRNVTTPAAFHVRRSGTLTTPPPFNIEFDQIVYEIGGIWNIQSSSFLAPVKGVYVFFFSLLSQSATSGQTNVGIMVNGEIKQRGVAWNTHFEPFSASAIVELNQLDQVYCRLLAGRLYSDGGGTTSNLHFIGYLLYQLE